MESLTAAPRAALRARRRFLIGGVLLALLTGAAFIPAPLSTVAEGVVWIPDEAMVRAPRDGVAVSVLALAGAAVARGQELVRLEDVELAGGVTARAARLDALAARLDAEIAADRVAADLTRQDIRAETAALTRDQEQLAQLSVRAAREGRFTALRPRDLIGRRVRRGDILGYLVAPGPRTARVVVRQGDIDLVRHRVLAVEARLPGRPETLPGRVAREVPGASEALPSAALTVEGGGGVAVERRDREQRALERLFQFEIALDEAQHASPPLGGRIFVRFFHGYEPPAFRWARRLRAVFLSQAPA